MTNYDIAFSLNREVRISADTYEEAKEKLEKQLESEGINLETYTIDIFDVLEEGEDD